MRFKRLYVEITNRCNLHCDFCPPHHRAERMMTVDEFVHVLDEAAPYVRHLYFHIKGEPLMHPDVASMAEAAAARGFCVNLTTNGTLLDRWPGLYRHLRQLNVSLHAAEHPEQMLRQARAIRDTNVCLRLWRGPQDDAVRQLLAQTFGVSIGDEKRMVLSPGLFLSQAASFDWPELSSPPTAAGYCHGLIDQLGILADGAVVPCCLDHEGHVTLGNIHADPLKNILDTPRAQAIIEGFRRQMVVEPLCRSCTYRRRF